MANGGVDQVSDKGNSASQEEALEELEEAGSEVEEIPEAEIEAMEAMPEEVEVSSEIPEASSSDLYSDDLDIEAE